MIIQGETAEYVLAEPAPVMGVVVRLSPPDRRTPIDIARGKCPAGGGCACCPNNFVKKRRHDSDSCALQHPEQDKRCSPPWPERIPACAERKTLPQDGPIAPAGFWTPISACCIECGRVTARRWTDPEGRVLPWCAGQMPDPEAK